jgi:hypothetical protein
VSNDIFSLGLITLDIGLTALCLFLIVVRVFGETRAEATVHATFLITAGMGALILGSLIFQAYPYLLGAIQNKYTMRVSFVSPDNNPDHSLANASSIVIGLASIFVAAYLRSPSQPRSIKYCLWLIFLGGCLVLVPVIMYCVFGLLTPPRWIT